MKSWKNNNGQTTAVAGAIVAIAFIIMTSLLLMQVLVNISPPTPTPWDRNTQVYSYLVFKDEDGNTLAKNGLTQKIDYDSSNASSTLQFVINSVGNSSGGSVYLKLATYTISQTLNISKPNISIAADPGTRLESTIMPMLVVWGSTDWWTMADIHLSDIAFIYRGPYASGSIVRFHYVIAGIYGGGASITNVKIWNLNGGAFPTNRDFIGLQLEDCIGVHISSLSLSMLGTGIQYGTTWHDPPGFWYDGSHNLYQYVSAGYCYQAVWYKGIGVTNEVWTQLKVQVIARYGIISTVNGAPAELTLDSPQIEQMSGVAVYAGSGNYQAAIELAGTRLMCTNGLINPGVSSDAYGFRLNASSAVITNTVFHSPGHPIDVKYEQLTLTQNEYWGVNTKVTKDAYSYVRSFNDPYVTENHGYNYTTGAVNTIAIWHGCSVTPISVVITPATASFGPYGITSVNTTYFVVWFTNQPGEDYWGFFWIAQAWL